jgi:hypothetical protein
VGKEELSAFREGLYTSHGKRERTIVLKSTGAILEAWELAPWPQFRLGSPSGSKKDAGIQTAMPSNQSHLVCSLRTISPPVWKASDNDDGASNTDLKFRHDLLPSADCLQKNVVAEKESKEHKITWSYNDHIEPGSGEADKLEEQGRGSASGTGEYVRSLKLGDTVTVWAKARFPGWVNVIDDVKIDIYWAV